MTDKCTIGYSCGEACINTSYECRADMQGDEAKLANAYIAKGKSIRKAETDAKYSVERKDNTIEHKYAGKTDKVSYEAKAIQITSEAAIANENRAMQAKPEDAFTSLFDVSFKINDTFDVDWQKGADYSAEDIAKATTAVKKATMALLNKLPDNAFIALSVYTGDDKGDKRAKLYKRLGFKHVPNAGDMMGAIKRNGKIYSLPDYMGYEADAYW